AGTNILVNADIDGRTLANGTSSGVTLTAGQNVTLNKNVQTKDAVINVTATNGTVTTAANQGLFAGAAAINVGAGQLLSSGITETTGAVSLRSTNGAVDVDAAIDATVGPVTIQAATDVNVNQGIANKLGTSPLNVTAGNNINVNASIDGRDVALPGSSGTVTM